MKEIFDGFDGHHYIGSDILAKLMDRSPSNIKEAAKKAVAENPELSAEFCFEYKYSDSRGIMQPGVSFRLLGVHISFKFLHNKPSCDKHEVLTRITGWFGEAGVFLPDPLPECLRTGHSTSDDTDKPSETATELVPFIFDDDGQQHKVRVVVENGITLFVNEDVCQALDIVDDKQAYDRLDDDERGWCSIPTPYGPQRVRAITEPGLYNLTSTSKKPNAKKFWRWVRHDVLPEIRKTGRYEHKPQPDNQLADKLDRIERFIIAREAKIDELEQKNVKLENENVELQNNIIKLKPKAEANDHFRQINGLHSPTRVAKQIEMEWLVFRQLMIDHDILHEDKVWVDNGNGRGHCEIRLAGTVKAIRQGIVTHRPHEITRRDGRLDTVMQVYFTNEGLDWAFKNFGKKHA